MRAVPFLTAIPIACVLLGCVEEGVPRGTYVRVPGGRASRSLIGARPILYLNRCRETCTFEPGRDDSRRNRSAIVPSRVTLPEFSLGDEVWKETVDCVRRLYEPFEIHVTDEDPGELPHFESVVAGHPRDLGMDPGIGGVAPFACGLLENGVNFNFAEVHGGDALSLCNTVGQESGHTFGLDHQLRCDDPMTYLPACGTEKAFRRVDAACGEFEERPCVCGSDFQNSYLTLLEAFGPRSSPIDFAPNVRVAVPEDRSWVRPRFRVFVEAEDDGGIERVELSIGGRPVGTSTAPPYGFIAPEDLPEGDVEIVARAFDRGGQSTLHRSAARIVRMEPRP